LWEGLYSFRCKLKILKKEGLLMLDKGANFKNPNLEASFKERGKIRRI